MRNVLLTLTLVLSVQGHTWAQQLRGSESEFYSSERRENLEREMNESHPEFQNKEQAGDERFSFWCDSRRTILDRAHRLANQHLRFGEYDTAYSIIINAFLKAQEGQQVQSFESSPMSFLLITRGLMLAERLDSNQSEVFIKTKVIFMLDYLSHVSQTLMELDRPFYTSWSQCGYCHNGRGRRFEFESSLLRFTLRQLSLTNSLVVQNGQDRKSVV